MTDRRSSLSLLAALCATTLAAIVAGPAHAAGSAGQRLQVVTPGPGPRTLRGYLPARVRPMTAAETKLFMANASGDFGPTRGFWRGDRGRYYRWTENEQPLIDDLAKKIYFDREARAPLPLVLETTIEGQPRVVGVLAGSPGKIDILHTDASLRQQGLRGTGSILMQHALKQAWDRGLDAKLEALPTAVPFYCKLGFKPTEPVRAGRSVMMCLPHAEIPTQLQQIGAKYR